MSIKSCEVLVIGAGLAGIAAARALQEAGVDVLLVDNGSSVGGRMATRRIGAGAADHGAQFFTADSPEFQQIVDGWEAEGFAFLWDIGWSTGSFTGNEGPDHARYAVPGGMGRLMNYLAANLPTETSTSIVAVRRGETGWDVEAANGDGYVASALILTPPPPRALQLLAAGNVHLSPMDGKILGQLTYSSTITGIFRIEGEVAIPAPGAVHRPAEPLPWIADNRQKKVSPDETVITVNSNGAYASRYWDAPEVEIIETMQSVLSHYLKPGSRMVESQIKRWRYAFPRHTHSQRTLRTSDTPPLYFAGDAFHGPLIEGAWLSGRAAAAGLLADPEFKAQHPTR